MTEYPIDQNSYSISLVIPNHPLDCEDDPDDYPDSYLGRTHLDGVLEELKVKDILHYSEHGGAMFVSVNGKTFCVAIPHPEDKGNIATTDLGLWQENTYKLYFAFDGELATPAQAEDYLKPLEDGLKAIIESATEDDVDISPDDHD